jgi:hypothetical protein
MQTLAIPGWIWVNMVLLVAAAIFVRVKLGKTSSARKRQGGSPVRTKRDAAGGVAPTDAHPADM